VLQHLAAKKLVIEAASTIPSAQLRYAAAADTTADPHVWLDPSLWAIVAENITQSLIRLDPDRRTDYLSRLEAYRDKLNQLDSWCKSEIRSIPAERRVLITAHDAFGYFGRAYDIEVHGIQGMSTDSEASIREINRLVSLIVERRIPAIFIESSVSPRAVEALIEGARSRGMQVTLGGELYSDAIGAPSTAEGTYLGMIRHNTQQIKDALSKRGP
jgi:manganese/zinc/iron transport system substrate-binding protein